MCVFLQALAAQVHHLVSLERYDDERREMDRWKVWLADNCNSGLSRKYVHVQFVLLRLCYVFAWCTIKVCVLFETGFRSFGAFDAAVSA